MEIFKGAIMEDINPYLPSDSIFDCSNDIIV